ncbi:MAG: segregation/condensation protein A [Chloroflexi bacterium]|nr:segregation/condensation protein A [Chloroflexota bacterium]
MREDEGRLQRRDNGYGRVTRAGAPRRGGIDLRMPMPEISLPVFKGPLDLLLHLIERDDLDVTAVSLVAVTDQYLRAIHHGSDFDPQALAEFVAIGARLIYLKSRALLPRVPSEAPEAIEEDEVGQELVDLLLEYRRFTAITDMLEERQDLGLRLFPRLAAAPPPSDGHGLDGVTVDHLLKLMQQVLKRKPPEPRAIIQRDTLTLSGRIEEFRLRLQKRGKFSFRQAILECRTRLEVVISFMAVLELLKSGECDATQPTAWGEIEVVMIVEVVAS